MAKKDSKQFKPAVFQKDDKITAALMEVMTKEAIDGPRYFYSRIGTVVVEEITKELEATADGENSPTQFLYDEVVSKQVGHHVYMRRKGGGAHIPLTPIK